MSNAEHNLSFPETTEVSDSSSPNRAKDSFLSAPRLLLAEHILGSIPLWQVKSKRVGTSVHQKEVTREMMVNGEVRRIPLVIYASGNLGLPTSLDLELFRAFEQRVLEEIERVGTIPEVVRISGSELLRYAGKELAGSAYAELDRFFLRMKGTMISAGRGELVGAEESGNPGGGVSPEGSGKTIPRSRKQVAFQVFSTVVLPGQLNTRGEVTDLYEVELASWYRESLLAGNCFVVDHSLFRSLHGSITKLLHQLLHNLFYLQRGRAEQRYSDLVKFWNLRRHTSRSLVLQQFTEAHEELMARGFLRTWEVIATGTRGQRDYLFVWEAGPAWWSTDAQVHSMLAKFELGTDAPMKSLQTLVHDPVLSSLIEDQRGRSGADSIDEGSAVRLLDTILDLSGQRKNPDVWVKFWKRAIATVPHAFIWRRIGEVRERKAKGERLNMGSYLARLVKIDAKKVGALWAQKEP